MALDSRANRTGYTERSNDGEIVQVDNIQQYRQYSELVARGLSNNIAVRTSLAIIIGRCSISTTDGMQLREIATLFYCSYYYFSVFHYYNCHYPLPHLVLTSAITAIVTALLATVIFVLVQIVVSHLEEPRLRLQQEEGRGRSMKKWGEEWPRVIPPSYMEVGENTNAFDLKENEAICWQSRSSE